MKESKTTYPDKRYSIEEYLLMEESAEYKSEYWNGEIKAMSGASPRHCALGNRIGTLLENELEDKNCLVFTSDLKVFVESENRYFYPDCSVVCGEISYGDEKKYSITNPIIIVEILSPSTESKDRSTKFQFYRELPSLEEYVLISQDKPLVEVYTRKSENVWQMTVIDALENTFRLESLSCDFSMEKLYKKIRWD